MLDLSQRLLSSTEASSYLGVTPKTLKRWEEEGRFIPTKRVGVRQDRKYSVEDLEAFQEKLKLGSK